MAPPTNSKKTEGRKKIDMKLIEDENARTVTFSKRRSGIFKKATELSVLCGAQVAVFIFSLCGRAYTFGHPSVESVIARLLNRNPIPNLQDSVHGRTAHAATAQQLKEQCEDSLEELGKKKKRRRELEVFLERSPYYVTEENLGKLDLQQLKEMKERMVALREKLVELKSKSVAAEVGNKAVVDLGKVEGDGDGASSIPSDWLKL